METWGGVYQEESGRLSTPGGAGVIQWLVLLLLDGAARW